jgi:hypothetical protein
VHKRIISTEKDFITAYDEAHLLKNLGFVKENGGGRIKEDVS